MLSKEEIEKAKERLSNLGESIQAICKEKSNMATSIETLLQYIDQLEQENNKLNKMNDAMAEQLYKLQYMSDPTKDCFIPREYSDINDCVKKASCQECIKQYFEKKVEENNVKD